MKIIKMMENYKNKKSRKDNNDNLFDDLHKLILKIAIKYKVNIYDAYVKYFDEPIKLESYMNAFEK